MLLLRVKLLGFRKTNLGAGPHFLREKIAMMTAWSPEFGVGLEGGITMLAVAFAHSWSTILKVMTNLTKNHRSRNSPGLRLELLRLDSPTQARTTAYGLHRMILLFVQKLSPPLTGVLDKANLQDSESPRAWKNRMLGRLKKQLIAHLKCMEFHFLFVLLKRLLRRAVDGRSSGNTGRACRGPLLTSAGICLKDLTLSSRPQLLKIWEGVLFSGLPWSEDRRPSSGVAMTCSPSIVAMQTHTVSPQRLVLWRHPFVLDPMLTLWIAGSHFRITKRVSIVARTQTFDLKAFRLVVCICHERLGAPAYLRQATLGLRPQMVPLQT